MSFRWRGLLASGVCLLGLAWGGFGLQAATTEAAAAAASLLRIDHHSSRALALVNDARAAQRAYVTWGPQTRDWEADVSAALGAVTRELDQLQTLVHSASAQSDLDAAKASLQAFAQTDEQARARLRESLRTETAGLILGDGADAAASVLDHLRSASESLRADASLAVSAAHREIRIAAAIAAGFVLVSLLIMLLPSRAATGEEYTDSPASYDALDLRFTERALPEAMISPPLLPPTSAMLLQPAVAPVSDALAVLQADVVINWSAVGEICTDFARITEMRDLKSLLDKSVSLLDADGLVVWIAEPSTRQLRPVMSLGFEPSTTRLADLSVDAYNAMTTALRTGSLQIVGSSPVKPGAIVSPLVTAAGCIGVIALEMRGGRERSPATCALARIIAAQMSAVLGTEPIAAGGTSAEAV